MQYSCNIYVYNLDFKMKISLGFFIYINDKTRMITLNINEAVCNRSQKRE